MRTETSIQGLNAALQPIRRSGKCVGFVPTMGNLHQGHLSLVKEAKRYCDVVVVSIFVNPTQFGENEDFASYPRTLDADCQLLADVDCDIVFAPSVEQVYGDVPRLTTVHVAQVTELLCGQSRKGHFDGVATIVTKLFNMVQPNMAFFGQKDWQQLVVIQALVRDLNLPIEIVGVPIARAEDGLALSSRNGYLSAQERQVAPTIYQALQHAKQQLQQQQVGLDVALATLQQTLQEAGFVVDYVVALSPALEQVEAFQQDTMLFVAAKLGTTRLIDNLLVPFTA